MFDSNKVCLLGLNTHRPGLSSAAEGDQADGFV
jgi:hypothetical protein